jgi:hypothetical protein
MEQHEIREHAAACGECRSRGSGRPTDDGAPRLGVADRARGVIAGKPPKRKAQGDLKRAAGRYFMRLQISHLFEGLKIIEEIANDPMLERLVGRLHREAQQAFETLRTFQSEPEYKFMLRIRHNISSHYDPEPVKKSLHRIEARRQKQIEMRKSGKKGLRKPIDVVKISVAGEPYKSQLVPWEMVENDIVLHDIFKLGESYTYNGDKELDAAADAIMSKIGDLRGIYSVFAYSFIMKNAPA